jgi:phycoerythrin-associated linker protein
MVSTFMNTGIGTDADRQNQFYQAYQPFKETAPVELCPGFSDEDADVVIRAVYRQVMGNAHVMESERSIVAESQLKQGELTVREFVRRLAKSAFYRARFFESCDRYRSMELNYKHLLGRAPDNFDEMRYHSNVLDRDGFEADIDTYLDSDEYQTAFGEAIVPYYRGYRTQAGQSMLEFTNMLQLLRSASSSDRNLATNNKPQLTRAIIQNSPYGKQRISDVSAILAEIFKRQEPAISTPPGWSPTRDYVAEQALPPTDRVQAQTIDRLQQQLADLRPFAAIGSAYLNNNGQTTGGSAPTAANGKVASQTAQIAMLQDQIADARRYATIGEARLNKWRSRVFNG